MRIRINNYEHARFGPECARLSQSNRQNRHFLAASPPSLKPTSPQHPRCHSPHSFPLLTVFAYHLEPFVSLMTVATCTRVCSLATAASTLQTALARTRGVRSRNPPSAIPTGGIPNRRAKFDPNFVDFLARKTKTVQLVLPRVLRTYHCDSLENFETAPAWWFDQHHPHRL